MRATFALSALRRKRAYLAGEIEAVERQIAAKRGALAQLDATILLFNPAADPDLIGSFRPILLRDDRSDSAVISVIYFLDRPNSRFFVDF